MEVLSEHLCQGWLEGYVLTGRHGLFNCYEAFIHIVDSMFNQHAKWLKVTRTIPWRRPIASLNYLLSSHVWRQDHNGFSHQDPGFIDHVMNKKAEVIRVYLPPDANMLLSVGDHCLRSRHYVNVIVAGKQPCLDYLSMEDAIVHCTLGIGIWDWASNDDGGEPDVVMACCGDVPTLETLAAVSLLREHLPDLQRARGQRRRPDAPPAGVGAPHGLSDAAFDSLFTTDRPIVFAYHGYPWLIHRLAYRRTNHANLHVRGYKEEGTTTTPFDMVMLNDLDRFHLVMDVIDRVPGLASRAGHVRSDMEQERLRCRGLDARARRGPPVDPRLDLELGLTTLVVNAGSTSLKLHLVAGDGSRAIDSLEEAGEVDAVAHRVVHGGPRFREPVLLDDAVEAAIRALESIAPLHNRPALPGSRRPDALCQAFRRWPSSTPRSTGRSQTRHRRMRCRASGVRTGASAGTASTACRCSGAPSAFRCRASSSATSAAAARSRRSGTADRSIRRWVSRPLEGVPMATRSGSVDPGALLYLIREHGLDASSLDEALEHESGLKALAGSARRTRARAAGEPRARRLRPSPRRRGRGHGRSHGRSRRDRLHRGDRRRVGARPRRGVQAARLPRRRRRRGPERLGRPRLRRRRHRIRRPGRGRPGAGGDRCRSGCASGAHLSLGLLRSSCNLRKVRSSDLLQDTA